MPKFVVTEQVPCVHIWTYEVEAANQSEALEMVAAGKVEATDVIVDGHDYDETLYDVNYNDADDDDIPNTNHGVDGL